MSRYGVFGGGLLQGRQVLARSSDVRSHDGKVGVLLQSGLGGAQQRRGGAAASSPPKFGVAQR